MIEKIHMRNVASYDDTGVELDKLNKINFIYGTNGTGKSTLSNFLNDSTEERFNHCTKHWKNEIALSILVYNKRFREDNFGKEGNINGVFTLGKATKEEKDAIDKKKIEVTEAQAQYLTKKSSFDNLSKEQQSKRDHFRDNKSWTGIYKKHETNFKEAFKGYQKKETFRDQLLKEYAENKGELFTFKELQEKAETVFGKKPEKLRKITELEFERILEIERNGVWKKKIIGKSDVDIAKLIQSLSINDWVSEGKNYIQDDSDICPFCQEETITEDFKKQLDNYFDKTFIDSTKEVKDLKDEYLRLCANLINALNLVESSEKDNKDTKLDIDKFSTNLKTLTSQLSSNKEYLNIKEKEPSRFIELLSTQEQFEILQTLIQNANRVVDMHNDIVDNYNSERDKLISAIWKYIIVENNADIEAYVKEVSGRQKGIEKLKSEFEAKYKKWKDLELELKKLSENATSIEPTVNEINTTLKTYGFLNFEIVPFKDTNFYQIKREDGTLAESTLSEGEITFITFLYFMQLAKGALEKDKISEERVLVIDDPVSSLDSNVLFVVSTLIKDVIKNIKADEGFIKQLILFTHNVYFHKEVAFIDGRTEKCKHTWYWILRKNNKVSNIQYFEMNNPIKTSYGLLWSELKERKNNSLISIQNVMRRIIENYFKILGKYGDDKLIQLFKTKEEQEICRSLISWINDGSHSINDDLYVEYQDDTVDKYMEVFKQIFVETKHEEHYNMMMGIDTSLVVNEDVPKAEEIIS